MKAIEQLHKLVDGACEKLKEKSDAAGKPITCAGKGCCHCCYEPIYCSTAEVEHILEGMTTGQKWDVMSKVDTAIAAVKTTTLFDQNLPPVDEWIKLKVPCPFLEKGECTVYERRPYPCRMHLAIKHPDTCRDDRLNQKYAMWDEEGQGLLGNALLASHIESGLMLDNMLVLLHNALGGEHMETASALKVEFVDGEDKPR